MAVKQLYNTFWLLGRRILVPLSEPVLESLVQINQFWIQSYVAVYFSIRCWWKSFSHTESHGHKNNVKLTSCSICLNYLGNNKDILALLPQLLADIMEVWGFADEGGKHNVHILFHTKLQVRLYRGNKRKERGDNFKEPTPQDGFTQ